MASELGFVRDLSLCEVGRHLRYKVLEVPSDHDVFDGIHRVEEVVSVFRRIYCDDIAINLGLASHLLAVSSSLICSELLAKQLVHISYINCHRLLEVIRNSHFSSKGCVIWINNLYRENLEAGIVQVAGYYRCRENQ